jgi:glycosyltransferase involved in cell wall biosynthesis
MNTSKCLKVKENERLLCEATIAVVIPAKNEECHIQGVLEGLPGWVDHAIVVDDGSIDRTHQIASESLRCTHLVRHKVSKGVGAAIASGYRLALELDATVIAVMAGDDQMRPEELVDLVLPVLQGELDYAKGNRLAHPRALCDMPRARRVGTKVLSKMTRWVSGIHTMDAQCGYTAISQSTLKRLPLHSLYPRYGYPNDLLAMLGCVRAKVGEFVVSPVYAGQASGIRVNRALFTHSWVLLRAAWLNRSRRRVSATLECQEASEVRTLRSNSDGATMREAG